MIGVKTVETRAGAFLERVNIKLNYLLIVRETFESKQLTAILVNSEPLGGKQ